MAPAIRLGKNAYVEGVAVPISVVRLQRATIGAVEGEAERAEHFRMSSRP